MVAFTKRDLGHDMRFVVYLGEKEKIKVTGIEIARGPGHEAMCAQFRDLLIEQLIVDLAKAAPLDASQVVRIKAWWHRCFDGYGLLWRRRGSGAQHGLGCRQLGRISRSLQSPDSLLQVPVLILQFLTLLDELADCLLIASNCILRCAH